MQSGPDEAAPAAAAEHVVLVDAQDRCIGTAEKLEAHRTGQLHRAFSAFVFDTRGRLLLQRRSLDKYHCPGLWTNTCCSHPRPGELVTSAVVRRLAEEMGIDCELRKAFEFVYRADVGGGLVEHEFDHVFIGRCDGPVRADPDEVMEVRWVAPEVLLRDLRAAPEQYSPWFRLAIERVLEIYRTSF